MNEESGTFSRYMVINMVEIQMVPIEKRYPASAFGTRKTFIALIFTNASDRLCRTCMLINIHSKCKFWL